MNPTGREHSDAGSCKESCLESKVTFLKEFLPSKAYAFATSLEREAQEFLRRNNFLSLS